VAMQQQELAAVLEVAVANLDGWLAEVGELREELLLHLAELAVDDLPAMSLLVEAINEQLLVDRELGGQELVDEGDVVVMPANLEDLVAPRSRLRVPVAPRDHVIALVERGRGSSGSRCRGTARFRACRG
jgi:hypothetical protein